MKVLAILLAIAVMEEPDTWPYLPPPTLPDLEFAAAVEDFARATPPEPYRSLIEDLGQSCYACRQIATKKLLRASIDNQRWLFWGRRHRDPEVRARCNLIIRRLNPCTRCHGTGKSQWSERAPCSACVGTKTAWVFD